MKPYVSAAKPIDYYAIAIRLTGRSPLATSFLAVQTAGRKTGLKKTNTTTLRHKAKTCLKVEISEARAEAILHLFSEFGLGSIGKSYGEIYIQWNPRLDMFKLGEACSKLRQQWHAARKVEDVGKGKTVVCMLPSSSLAALTSTGLAKTLEIEILRK